jgi:tRNA modification GTPase
MNAKPTIFAVSSGSGRAGIAVVRVSGPAVPDILRTVCGALLPARQAVLRTIRSRFNHEIIDKALVLHFPAPRSVTGEDVCEFHVHGSAAVVEALLETLVSFETCRAAEPGEFTRRAYENERLDLVEVEGLADLLAAETQAQRRLAMRQFSGEASSIYEGWRESMLSCLAMIEASIDFADEDGVAAAAVKQVRPQLLRLLESLQQAQLDSERASLVRRGLRIVICGEPNVGKSSLLNALAGRNAAIVSDTAGTTRDVIEAPLVIAGLPVSLADTAGLRQESSDAIEREGIARSRGEIETADILLWVTAVDTPSLVLPGRKPDLLVANKCDLEQTQSIQDRNDVAIRISAKTGTGMDTLRGRLAELVEARTSMGEAAIMVRARHRHAVSESIRLLNEAVSRPDGALELMAEDVRNAAQCLAKVTGRIDVEEFLGRIFQEFCIGK